MKKLFFVTLFFLVACQPSAEVIEQAISETQAAIPTETPVPTPTQIPLSEIDLSELMFRDGDLPTGYSPGQIRSYQSSETNITQIQPVNEYNQELSYQGKKSGSISVEVFATVGEAEEVFEKKVEDDNDSGPGKIDVDGLGDYGFKIVYYYPGLMDAAFLFFRRCNTIVSAEIVPSTSIGGLIEYAKHLDNRLINLCR